jgi:hypothetical protein
MSCISLHSMTTHSDLAAITGTFDKIKPVGMPIPHRGEEDGAIDDTTTLPYHWDEAAVTQSYHDLTLEGPLLETANCDSNEAVTLRTPTLLSTGEHLAARVADSTFVPLDGKPEVHSDLPYSGVTHLRLHPGGISEKLPPTHHDGPVSITGKGGYSLDPSHLDVVDMGELELRSPTQLGKLDALATIAYESLQLLDKGTVVVGPQHKGRNARRDAFVDNCIHTLSLYQDLGKALQEADPSGAKYNVFLGGNNVPHGDQYFGTAPIPTNLMTQFIVGATVAQAMYDVAVQSYESGCSIEGLMPTLEPMEIERGVRQTYSEFAGSARNMLMKPNSGITARNALMHALETNRQNTLGETYSAQVGDTLVIDNNHQATIV